MQTTALAETATRVRRTHVITALLGALWIYVVARGGPWKGMFTPDYLFASLLILAGVVGAWLLVRTRAGWRWHATALDVVMPFWFVAFALSTLANLDATPLRLGLWASGLYILLWYIGNDVIANRFISREQLVDGLLIAGAVMLYASVRDWQAGTERIEAYLENANTLGAFLVLIVPLAVGRCFTARGFWRLVMVVYLVVSVVVSYAVGSRGAWLGMGAAAAIVVIYWRPRLVLVVLPVALVAFLFLYAMRGDTNRFNEYAKAIDMFREKPLTGYGLFTYRYVEVQANKTIQHWHAHNVVLNVAAELGIPGLLALVLTVVAVFQALRRNWGPTRLWATAALVGTAAHQMVDVAILCPANALSFLLVLCVALAPDNPTPAGRLWVGRLVIRALVVLAVVLWVVGMVARQDVYKAV